MQIVLGKQPGIPGSRRRLALTSQASPGDGYAKPLLRQPAAAVDRLDPAIGAAFRLMNCLGVVIEADPHRQPFAKLGAQRRELVCEPPHRPHRIGEYQHREAAPQGRTHHRDHIGVHERLTAGKADFARAEVFGLVKISVDLGQRHVNQGIVGRRAFDITGFAGQVTQRAGVDPQRLEPLQGDLGAGIAEGRAQRIPELGAIERSRLRHGEGRSLGADLSGDHGSPWASPSPIFPSTARRARS